MSRSASAARTGDSAPVIPKWVDGYFRRSELPLYSLVFLLPLIVIFEIGTYFHPSPTIAQEKMQEMFQRLGATGRFLPALAVVGILLAWHIARKDDWKIRWQTLYAMAAESVLFALPLMTLSIAIAQWQIGRSGYGGWAQWRDMSILSVGAGIYEELVFRLAALVILHFIFSDWLKLKPFWSFLLMVSISAILFSLYHYWGQESFNWRSFTFRTIAGIYFAVLFLNRGFGITCGCHIFYDLIVISLPFVR